MSTVREVFQSPRGDFGFLKVVKTELTVAAGEDYKFQSPRGDFGFLKGFIALRPARLSSTKSNFNPLAGILVF